MSKSENWDFTEAMQESFIKHMDHIFNCPGCAWKLAELLREVQNHAPEILSKDEIQDECGYCGGTAIVKFDERYNGLLANCVCGNQWRCS